MKVTKKDNKGQNRKDKSRSGSPPPFEPPPSTGPWPSSQKAWNREAKSAYQYRAPQRFMGETITGTNAFAYFSRRSHGPRGPKHFEKNAFQQVLERKLNFQVKIQTMRSWSQPWYTRERKMRTNFFCTNFSSTPRGPGHPGQIPGTSQIPLLQTQGRQTFEAGHELSREGTNFSATTPSRGRPPPHRAVSGPEKLLFVLLFSCLNHATPQNPWTMSRKHLKRPRRFAASKARPQEKKKTKKIWRGLWFLVNNYSLLLEAQ